MFRCKAISCASATFPEPLRAPELHSRPCLSDSASCLYHLMWDITLPCRSSASAQWISVGDTLVRSIAQVVSSKYLVKIIRSNARIFVLVDIDSVIRVGCTPRKILKIISQVNMAASCVVLGSWRVDDTLFPATKPPKLTKSPLPPSQPPHRTTCSLPPSLSSARTSRRPSPSQR
jgi:hypothetical protein